MNTVARFVSPLVCAGLLSGQGRPVDWPSYGGDARRTGWERSDTRITKDNVKDFQLVLKRTFEQKPNGARSLSPPVIIGLLISYRGFKELGFIGGTSGGLWSLDVDIDRVFWEKRFEPPATKPKAGRSPLCSDTLMAMPALTPPMTFGGRRPSRPPITPRGTPVSPGEPPTPAGRSTALPARVGAGGFGAPRPVYVLTSDGKLHQVNTSDGSDQFPPLNFLPAGSQASVLTLNDNILYTTTDGSCGSGPNGVWAINLAQEEPTVRSFPLTGAAAGGLGGVAIGTDGTVYAQTGPGPSDAASGKWSNTLLALSPGELKLKGHFSVETGPRVKSAPGMNVTTPVVFDYKGRDMIVSAGADGSLYLLDSQSPGGSDNKTPLYKTQALALGDGSGGGGVWGGISSWEDSDGVRWVAAPVWGRVNPELKGAVSNGATPNGAIVAFKLEEQDGKPSLIPAWISRDMSGPQPPVITSGIVFAVSGGSYTREGMGFRPDPSSHATLYAFEGASGKEIYSTGNQVTAPANLTGTSLANGRVFFTTTDSTLYGFGIYLER